MGNQKDNRHIYLSKRSLLKEEYNSGRLSELYSSHVDQHQISVIIPIKNEFPDFFNTLESLNQSWLSFFETSFCEKSSCEKEKILVILVVNALKDDSEAVIKNNEKLLLALEEAKNQEKYKGLDFFVVNLNPPMGFLPEKQGVGYARKLGMDYAIFFGCKIFFHDTPFDFFSFLYFA